jgi:REP element-mobilizing transposase RayT
MKQTLLKNNKFYHIYNKGRKGENIFIENDNYEHFLHLYEKYIEPIANTYAWVLLPNHFHFLIKLNDKTEKPPHQYFSNLFNAYTKSFNKRYNRYGPLFVSPFKRIEINNSKYFKNLIYYIHNNPVKHGFVEKMFDYPWSSYLTIISIKKTKLKRDTVIGWFNNKKEFIEFHSKNIILNNKFTIE